jgi:hypothetical protein
MRGKIIASCGHEIPSTDDGVDVEYPVQVADEDGIHWATAHAFYCKPCAAALDAISWGYQ